MTYHPFKYNDIGLKSRISKEHAVAILSSASRACQYVPELVGMANDGVLDPKYAPMILEMVELHMALMNAGVELIDVEHTRRTTTSATTDTTDNGRGE